METYCSDLRRSRIEAGGPRKERVHSVFYRLPLYSTVASMYTTDRVTDCFFSGRGKHTASYKTYIYEYPTYKYQSSCSISKIL